MRGRGAVKTSLPVASRRPKEQLLTPQHQSCPGNSQGGGGAILQERGAAHSPHPVLLEENPLSGWRTCTDGAWGAGETGTAVCPSHSEPGSWLVQTENSTRTSMLGLISTFSGKNHVAESESHSALRLPPAVQRRGGAVVPEVPARVAPPTALLPRSVRPRAMKMAKCKVLPPRPPGPWRSRLQEGHASRTPPCGHLHVITRIAWLSRARARAACPRAARLPGWSGSREGTGTTQTMPSSRVKACFPRLVGAGRPLVSTAQKRLLSREN